MKLCLNLALASLFLAVCSANGSTGDHLPKHSSNQLSDKSHLSNWFQSTGTNDDTKEEENTFVSVVSLPSNIGRIVLSHTQRRLFYET